MKKKPRKENQEKKKNHQPHTSCQLSLLVLLPQSFLGLVLVSGFGSGFVDCCTSQSDSPKEK